MTDIIEQLKKELKQPPKIKVLDLSQFITLQEKKPKFKIGVIGDVPKNFIGYKKGDVVLFTPYTIDEEYMDCFSKELEHRIQHCTVEIPNDRYFKGETNVDTVGTTVYFPLKYIQHEILIKQY